MPDTLVFMMEIDPWESIHNLIIFKTSALQYHSSSFYSRIVV